MRQTKCRNIIWNLGTPKWSLCQHHAWPLSCSHAYTWFYSLIPRLYSGLRCPLEAQEGCHRKGGLTLSDMLLASFWARAHWFMMASSTVSHVGLAFQAFFCGCGWLLSRREPLLVFLFSKTLTYGCCVKLSHAGRMSQHAIMCDGRRRHWYWV